MHTCQRQQHAPAAAAAGVCRLPPSLIREVHLSCVPALVAANREPELDPAVSCHFRRSDASFHAHMGTNGTPTDRGLPHRLQQRAVLMRVGL
jgi:hypothetical protein